MKDSLYSNVSIFEDETKMQRDYRRKLKIECDELNSNLSSEEIQENLEWRVVSRNGQSYRAKTKRRTQPPRGSSSANFTPLGNRSTTTTTQQTASKRRLEADSDSNNSGGGAASAKRPTPDQELIYQVQLAYRRGQSN